MIKKRGFIMWNDILVKANFYEEKVKKRVLSNPKNNNLSRREINKKIRDSVNRKFKEETKIFLGVHMVEVLSNLHNTAYERF
jgi:hypothetical protein